MPTESFPETGFVKRVFGRNDFGDHNWRKMCHLEGVDSEGVFQFRKSFAGTLQVNIGTKIFTSRDQERFKLVNTGSKKDLKEFF